MKIEREYIKVYITVKGEKSVLNMHPWIYDTEVVNIDGTYLDGDIVDVYNSKSKYLGTGFINSNSKIRVRIFTKNYNDIIDNNFWKRRIEYAYQYRLQVMETDDLGCMRIIFGEADGFPGLTVDRFNDVLVCETLSLGMERLKNIIFPILIEVLKEYNEEINAIYERNDSPIRIKEGMTQFKGYFYKSEKTTSTKTTIIENGIKYEVDYENGQKTGFFLDQKKNRLAIQKISKNKRVLDCCTHTGSFSFNAIKGGAISSCALDISELAIETTKKNAKLNDMDSKMTYIVDDVFDYLEKLSKANKNVYDFIILDPPAFTKSRKKLSNAIKGYKEINKNAMKSIKRGGYFATASCSSFATPTIFLNMLKEASIEANVELKLIEERRQSYDHPILINVSETEYLKFYIFQII